MEKVKVVDVKIMNFIEIVRTNGKRSFVNVKHIEEVIESDKDECYIYMAFNPPNGVEQDCIFVNKSYDEIVSMIKKDKELNTSAAEDAEWLTIDKEDDWLPNQYVCCSNCNRNVYTDYAGSWCTFCGKTMKNPMKQ